MPFSALVGVEPARQALLLLAVEPRLRGMLIAAPAGAGKSSLARGFGALLETPGAPHRPFVELPLGADEESLLGGLDLEATLRAGRRVARPGVFARTHGGVLHVDQVNLLADGSVNLLLAALDSGEVVLEREGLSLRSPAQFTLLGAYDPAEGPPRRHLMDRVGLLLALPATTDASVRAEVVRRNRVFAAEAAERADRPKKIISAPSARSGVNTYADELALLQGLVAAAREQLPAVQIADEQIEQLAAAAAAFGVEGHRVDLFAVHAARAAAALELRDAVAQEDLELAVRLVVLPRATRIPAPPEQQTADPEPKPQNAEQQTEHAPHDSDHSEQETQHSTPNAQTFEEQVLAALATELPAELDQLPFRAVRRGRAGSRGSTAGTRGRHVRSAPGDPRRARVDIAATLRAATPWQPLRRQSVHKPNEAQALPTNHENAHPARSSSVFRPPSLSLRAEDLRVKHYRSKAGALFCFAVDASGSMALHRMRQAKGAVHALLQQAYVQRDRVALLAFRGSRAELLLPPSQSVELARRALDQLPTGGGTPLAAALLAALDLARQARGRGIMQTVLVLLTDGRANVALGTDRSGVEAELERLGQHVAAAGIQTVVVDTQRSYLSRGEARRLAGWLGGQYVYLPNAAGEQIAAAALAARGE